MAHAHKHSQVFDQKTRYAPDKVGSHRGKVKVLQHVAHPVGQHPQSPIKPDLMALEMVCEKGITRWYGFKRVWINSELRMVVQGFDELNEEVSKWEVCSEF